MHDPTFIFKKTNQLTPSEKEQIRALFKRVFSKEKSVAHFDREFIATPLGYSYHALLMEGTVIVGCYSAIPYRYNFFGQECLFALSVDTMIQEEFRGLDRLLGLAKIVYAELLRDNIEFVFGFPNDNIYRIRKRFLGWKDLGQLNYFVLPLRAGAVWRWTRPLNFASLGLAYLVNIVGILWSRSTVSWKPNVDRVEDETFVRHRYGFFDGNYQRQSLPTDGAMVTYRLDRHKGIRIAFIIDVTVLSPLHLIEATRLIFRQHRCEIDAILYVGRLPFSPGSLFRLPRRLEPMKKYMSGKILAGKIVDERIYEIDRWKVNLSTFDVV